MQYKNIAVRTDLFHLSVTDPVGFTADLSPVFRLQQIASICDRVECVSETVPECDVFYKAHAVYDIILYSIIMRDHVVFCQSETRYEPFVIRVCRLSRHLRFRINDACAVHGAGTDAHHDPVKTGESFRKLHVFEKGILRWHMAASEYDKVITLKFISLFPSVPQVAYVHARYRQSGILNYILIVVSHPVIDLILVRKGGYEKTPGIFRPELLQCVHHPVRRIEAFIIQRLFTPVYPYRTARKKNLRLSASFFHTQHIVLLL